MERLNENSEPQAVGIWIRVSTEDQVRDESPEHHEKRARMYAESKGWQVVEVYHLEAVSGKTVIGLPETRRMMNDVKEGHICGLIFSKLARLARNTRELLEFADYFREYDAHLISLAEAIDTSSPAGRLFYTVVAAMAQWEREEISERVAASVPIRAKLGKPLGGAAPFGYRWENRRLVPDPNEASVRRLIYELFLTHRRKRAVARLLNQAGHRTRNGSKFTDTTVDRLLRDPLAKGRRRANYTQSLGEKKHWKYKPEDKWVWSEVEPIITNEIWEECNEILSKQSENGKRPGRRTIQLFSGLLYCECGAKMYVPSGCLKYTCQRCKNKLPVTDLEALFYEQLTMFLLTPSEILDYMAEADRITKEKQELLQTLEHERKRLSGEREKLLQLFYGGRISAEGFGEANRPQEERLRQLGDEIPRLQGEIDFLKIRYLSGDQVLEEARDLAKRWPGMEVTEKRSIIENVTERIVVGRDGAEGRGEIEFEFAYLPEIKRQRNLIPALPFCHRRFTVPRPPDPRVPAVLRHIGDHLRQKRVELGLTQQQVAKRLGVSESTILNYEKGNTTPSLVSLHRVIEFLGFDPLPPATTLGEKLRRYRQVHGVSQKQLAARLGVDPGTIASWEGGRHRPMKGNMKAIDALEEGVNSDDRRRGLSA